MTKNLAILLFIFQLIQPSITMASSEVIASSCQPVYGSCEYYQCKEKIQKCGTDGYHQRFGYPYCNSFLTEVTNRLSDQGKAWLLDVALCLQTDLEKMSYDSDPCWLTEEIAIRSHANCYVKTKACDLPKRDLVIVMNTIKSELQDSRVFWQGVSFLYQCVSLN